MLSLLLTETFRQRQAEHPGASLQTEFSIATEVGDGLRAESPALSDL
jgi:hypothetical protein